MNKFLSKLEERRILVSDGAWGTELIKKGFQTGSCPEFLNLEKEDEVFSIAKSYIEAGSDIISTNSFGASKIKLANFNLSDKTYVINKKAAEISKLAAGDKLVMGSIGPTGKFLITEEISDNELKDSFSEQIKGLIDGGVDAILFETFYDLQELEIGIDTAKQLSEIPIICSLTFEKNSEGKFYNLMGNSIRDCYSFLMSKDVDIVGVNCGTGYFDSVEIVKQIRANFSNVKILIQPNAGLPEIVENYISYSETPEKIIPAIKELIRLDVNIIGGCCGTNSEHIRVVRKIVDEKRKIK